MDKGNDKTKDKNLNAEVPKKVESRRDARQSVQRAMEQAEEEQRRYQMRRRIQLASQGLEAYKKGKFAEAVRNFQSYLSILENWKSVSAGGLSPSCFDAKKDVAEMLLISGVYWDLVKLYDQTQSASKKKEFLHYLEKYILFSRGMPFQPLCAETLRRYIAADRPQHKENFRNAYKLISDSRCFIATSLVDVLDVDTLPQLRELRDGYLVHRAWGRGLMSLYYFCAPALAEGVDRLPRGVRRVIARGVERVTEFCGQCEGF